MFTFIEFGEIDYVPWETFLGHIGTIDAITRIPMLHQYTIRLLTNLIGRLGWLETLTDELFTKKLRSIVLQAAVFYGHNGSRHYAQALYSRWMAGGVGSKVPANIRDIVYHGGVQLGGEKEWQHAWQVYQNTSTVPSEKRLLLTVLGATPLPHLLQTYLQASLNKSLVRSQDTALVIQAVARNPLGRHLVWPFVQANWKRLFTMVGGGSFSLDAIISESTWHFSSPTMHAQVDQFFRSVRVGSGKQAVRQSLEKIEANILWKEMVESKVIRWLQTVAQEWDGNEDGVGHH